MNNITSKFYDREKRIQKLRKEQNITQKQLCEYLNRTIQTISAIENGKQSYNGDTAKKIAGFLNVDYRYLTYDINAKTYKEHFDYVYSVMEKRKAAIFYLLNSYGYDIKQSGYLFNNGYIKECDIKQITNKTEYDPETVYYVTTPEQEKKIIHESDLISLFNDSIYLLNSRLMGTCRLNYTE